MTQRTSLLDSNNTQLNSDYDFSKLNLYLLEETKGVLFSDLATKPEFDLDLGTGELTAGSALILCQRASSQPIANQKFYALFQSDATLTVNVSIGRKIFIEISDSLVQNPSLIIDNPPSTDYAKGLNIGTIKSETSRPSHSNYIPLYEIIAGPVKTDLRTYPAVKGDNIDLSDLTQNIITTGDIEANNAQFNNVNAQAVQLPGGDVQTQIDNILSNGLPTISLVDKDTFIAGEDIDAGESFLPEDIVSFAESTELDLVGDVTANTRKSFIAFGTGVSGSTMKLALRKFAAPSVDFGFRVETDNAGSPSGTLVHANATGTILAATVTTGLVDTTLNFAGAFTIPRGTKVHIVMFQGTYGAETVNGTNYYAVGFFSKHTTTRTSKKWNGSAWSTNTATAVTDADGITFTSTTSAATSQGYRIRALKDLTITVVTKSTTSTATRCRVFDINGNLLGTATFSGNTATFGTPVLVRKNQYVRVECDNSGASYTIHRLNIGAVFPVAATNITYEAGSSALSEQESAGYNIDSITTVVVGPFHYVDGNMFEDTLLTLTDARFVYKVPFDKVPRLATASALAGAECIGTTYGLNDAVTGLTAGVNYYLSDTPGAIATTAGYYFYNIGRTVKTDLIRVEHIKELSYMIDGFTRNFTAQTGTTLYIEMGREFTEVEFGFVASEAYAGGPVYHGIGRFGRFICGSAGVQHIGFLTFSAAGSASVYGLSSLTTVSLSLTKEVAALTKVDGADTIGLTAIYKIGTMLVLDLTMTDTNYNIKQLQLSAIKIVN